ncbi:MAG: DUF4199 domain-containing protein [Cryomorphaceae bacterium]|nr:DUF4199 domain-containing protein [Cryomorphaceae bacterium]
METFKNRGIELKWALIFIAMTMLWAALENALGFYDSRIEKYKLFSAFISFPSVLIYYFGILEKRKKFFNNEMSFKQGFRAGVFMTLFIAVLSPVAQYFVSSYIGSQFFENAIAYEVQSGNMTISEAHDFYNLESFMWHSGVGAAFLGLFTSLVVAHLTKRPSSKIKPNQVGTTTAINAGTN